MKSTIGIVAFVLALKLVITPEIALYILIGLGLLMIALLLDRIFQN
jgi:hypothetical protein